MPFGFDARMLSIKELTDPQVRAFCFVHAVRAPDHAQWSFHKAEDDYHWLVRAEDEYEALTKEGSAGELQARYAHQSALRATGAQLVSAAEAALRKAETTLAKAKAHNHETTDKEAIVAEAKAALAMSTAALNALDSAVAAAKEKVDAVHNHTARYVQISVVAEAACEMYGEHTRSLRNLLNGYSRLYGADFALAS